MENIFIYKLNKLLKQIDGELSIYCIGSNKIVGDSLGPMVGSILKANILPTNVKIIGERKNPLTYSRFLKIKKQGNTNIFIDSALGKYENIGRIIINKEYITPGKALQKGYKSNKKEICIRAIVGENKNEVFDNINELLNIPYDYIEKFAFYIAKNIYETIINFV